MYLLKDIEGRAHGVFTSLKKLLGPLDAHLTHSVDSVLYEAKNAIKGKGVYNLMLFVGNDQELWKIEEVKVNTHYYF